MQKAEIAADNARPVGEATLSGRLNVNWVFIAIVVIFLINLAAFHRSLGGYFLADDFAHVEYLKTVFSGHPELLLRNFHTNWMQTWGTQFYRPFISITLAFDWLLWKSNANGFHIANFSFQALSSIFLFLSLNCMFPSMQKNARLLTAFLAASLFSCHPLHPEVVSWIIARVDSVTTVFLFLSLWLYLLGRQVEDAQKRLKKRLYMTFSLLSFAIALMSKEMAITLPPTIFLYEFINSYFISSDKKLSLFARLKAAATASLPHSAALLFYIGYRTFALGTLMGGYKGSIGEGLSSSLYRRWIEDRSLFRLLLPFNDEITSPKDSIRLVFKLSIASAIVLAIFRAVKQKSATISLPFKLSPFFYLSLGWCVIALAPTLQVWDITPDLQGARFAYLATAPTALMLAALAIGDGADRSYESKANPLLSIFSLILLSIFIFSYIFVGSLNNVPWMRASQGVSNLRRSVEEVMLTKQPGEQIAVVDLPQKNKGAHMLYNATMFIVALRPPLSKTDLSERVLTFEPINFGDATLISSSRFRRLLSNEKVKGVYSWDAEKDKLVQLTELGTASPPATSPITQNEPDIDDLTENFISGGNSFKLEGNDTLKSPALDLSSTDSDFLDFEIKAEGANVSGGALVLSWTGTQNDSYSTKRQLVLPLIPGTEFKKYRFSISERKSWICEGRINSIRLDTTIKPITLTLKSVRLVRAIKEIPTLAPASDNGGNRVGVEDTTGTVHTAGDLGPFSYDVTKIPGAQKVVYEISKPNSWFEHYSGTFRDTEFSKNISKTGTFKELNSTAQTINLRDLPEPGFYEMRIFAADAAGKVIGYASDPINFQLDAVFLKKKKNKGTGKQH
ncbi:MAG: hypothetical protein IAF58_11710 [Leptolyngbya sp.]|nr:hypothetical protein [Candidatus Melainabacteria bacterium]